CLDHGVGDQFPVIPDRRVASVHGAVEVDDRGEIFHLNAPAADSAPLMNWRWSNRNTRISGNVVNAVAAARPGMSVPFAAENPARPTSTGCTPAPDGALLVITSGHRKLFQLPMNTLIA